MRQLDPARAAEVVALDRVERRPRRIAIGQFDGVHRGHQQVIAGADTVLTFDPHPLAITNPALCPSRLMTLADKAEAVASLGVRELVVVPFDGSFARISPAE